MKISKKSKKCTVCKIEKDISLFYVNKKKEQIYSRCIPCHYEMTIANQRTERYKEWRRKYSKTPRQRAYSNQKTLKRQKTNQWKEWKKEYEKRRLREKPYLRIGNNMRSMIWQAIKKNKNGRSWERLVGYTRADLVAHLEKLFTPQINWENYGTYWHIDHIVPRVLFPYATPEDENFKLCWALSNLRPLEASENCSKGAKLTHQITKLKQSHGE